VLGGTNSLHTNSMDETLALPTEAAVLTALRTQQILAEETGVINTADPLGGSYAIEALTDRLEREAFEYIDKIDKMGGMIRAIELGFPQQEIADASYHYQRQLDRGEKVVVGVNKYQTEDEAPIETLRVDNEVERQQIARVRAHKEARDARVVAQHLADVRAAAENGHNLMPPIIAAVKAEVTVGEISDVFREVFGVYRDPAWI
jgi:methylmalonyl-CoA mutase N-terminal domain/subunit